MSIVPDAAVAPATATQSINITAQLPQVNVNQYAL